MAGLIKVRLTELGKRSHNAAAHEWCVQHRVDFIEGQPVFDLALVAVKEHPHIIFIEANEVMIDPAVVFLGQIERRFIVGNRHQRFNAVFVAFVEQIVIELQALFIRLCIIAVWENPAPGNGGAEHLEAHFGKEFDILFVAVVEVNRDQLHIVFCRLCRGCTFEAVGHDILNIESLAVLIVSTFTLIGGYRAAP